MLKIIVDTENEAFGDEPNREIARILRDLAHRIECGKADDIMLYDANGNMVGYAKHVKNAKD